MEEKRPRIPEFYSGRSVLVTGFSGFMGKLLVEKLLWSCPDIQRIYVILRGKRNLQFHQRFNKIINSDVFLRIRENKKEQLEKIHPLEGDVILPSLGLSKEQRSLLTDEVSLVFHSAASVKFDDPLPLALDVNVLGTKAVIELALELPKLVAFVHISTAYSNCDNFVIEEKVYPPKADWRKTLEIREKIDSSIFQILAPKYMNHMPNTYVFTKSLGEQIVSEYSDRLPVVIFRPSIVVASWEEPFAGWADNLNGPGGLSLGNITGVVRSILMNTDIQPDFMPADFAIRGLVVVGYARHYKREDGVHLYNWCAQDRSITFSQLQHFGDVMFDQAPAKYVLWRPTSSITASPFIFYINFLLFHLIPAIFVDLALRLAGKKPMLWKVQMKVFVAMRALSYFTLNYFYFSNKEAEAVERWVPEEDMPEFNYVRRPGNDEIRQYLYFTLRYLQRKYLKMEPHDYPAAFRISAIMKTLDRAVKTGFWMWILYSVYSMNLIPRLASKTLHFLYPELTL